MYTTPTLKKYHTFSTEQPMYIVKGYDTLRIQYSTVAVYGRVLGTVVVVMDGATGRPVCGRR